MYWYCRAPGNYFSIQILYVDYFFCSSTFFLLSSSFFFFLLLLSSHLRRMIIAQHGDDLYHQLMNCTASDGCPSEITLGGEGGASGGASGGGYPNVKRMQIVLFIISFISQSIMTTPSTSMMVLTLLRIILLFVVFFNSLFRNDLVMG